MTRGLCPILAVLILSMHQPAAAQGSSAGDAAGESAFSRSRNVSVRERPRPEYEALGIHAGAFYIFPKITGGLTYDDNIFATANNEESDWLYSLTPSVQVTSDWNRHMLEASASLNRTVYGDNSDEDFTTWTVSTDGRLDVDRNFYLSALGRYSRMVEPRTAIEAFQNVSRPVRYDRRDFTVGGVKTFNRLRFNGTLDYSDYIFRNGRTRTGALVNLKFRDDTITTGTLRADYTISPDTFVFVKGAYNTHEHRFNPGLTRDSDGYEFTAGADFDVTNLMRGQMEVGYLRQDYDTAIYGSFTGLQVRGRLEYFPTQLTTVTLAASRDVQDSGIPTSPGYLSTAVGLQLDHELLRNVIITGRGDYEHATYRGIDREDDRYNLSLGGTYLVNRKVGLSLTYNYLNQESDGLDQGAGFDDNRLLATVTLQY